jgi:arylesterase/paraoxonase
MKRALIVFVGLIVSLLAFVAYTLISTGFFRNINNTESYEIIAEIYLNGAEDFSINYEDAFMIISQDDRAAKLNERVRKGDLYYLKLDGDQFEPINLTEHLPIEFYPHGISLLKLDSMRYQILAVNHTDKGHSIEKFELLGDSIVHIKSYRDATMISPNDVIALDENSFYFTNDHGNTSKWGLFFENYLGLKVSNVIYFDGNYSIAADKIAYANGLNIDRVNNVLVVASPRDFRIKYYQIEDDGSLSFKQNVDVGTGVDNIEFDTEGNLWIGCHPSLLAFTSYAKGANEIAPSEVIVVSPEQEVRKIYENDGNAVSATSVAAPFNDLLFIGTVMDNKILILKSK